MRTPYRTTTQHAFAVANLNNNTMKKFLLTTIALLAFLYPSHGFASSLLPVTISSRRSKFTRSADAEVEAREVENPDNDTSVSSTLQTLITKESAEIARKTLSSLERCCKVCRIAVMADLVAVFIDKQIYSKLFTNSHIQLSWTDGIALLDTTNLLVFGNGIASVSKLYRRMLNDDPNTEPLSEMEARQYFESIGFMWMFAAIAFGVIAMGSGAALPSIARDGAFSRCFQGVTPGLVVASVFSFLAVADLSIRVYCREAVDRPIHSLMAGQAAGYRVFRNQALLMGSFTGKNVRV